MADLGDFTQYAKTYDAATTGEADETPQDTFAWFGETIRVQRDIGPMPFLAFADAAAGGLGTEDLEGLAAIHAMLRECIEPADFALFSRLATKHKVDGDGLLEIVGKIMEAETGRPTRQPSTSSDGSPSTSASSQPNSSQLVPDSPSLSTEERVARDLRIPLPPETRPDARAALRLVDEPLDLEAATG